MKPRDIRKVARVALAPIRFGLKAVSTIGGLVPEAADGLRYWLEELTDEPVEWMPPSEYKGPRVCSKCDAEILDESTATNMFPFGALCEACFEVLKANELGKGKGAPS